MKAIEQRLDRVLEQTVAHKRVKGAVAAVESGDGTVSYLGSVGNIAADDYYFIASTTKLYISAVIFILRSSGSLDLEDTLGQFFEDELIAGIHELNGQDRSNSITVRQLLSQTSGLPDYFEQKLGKQSLQQSLFAGEDRSWDLRDVLDIARQMKPKFPPSEQGKPGKAFYSDTNFQLLGGVIEKVCGEPIGKVFAELIFQPLGLDKTYLYVDVDDRRPIDLNYKTDVLSIPKAMASFGADGGIVSTASDSMTFVKAFFKGELFPGSYLDELAPWNRIFFPLEYGLGVSRFKLPRIFSPFKPTPEFIGHSGLSGAFEFYCPDDDLYFTGTVNQAASPGLSFRMFLKLHGEAKT